MDCIGIYDLDCVIQNQSFRTSFTFETDDEAETPINLLDYPNLRMGIYDGFNKEIDILTIGNGLDISGDGNNVLGIHIDEQLSKKLRGSGNYEILFATDGDQNNWYTLKGKIKVTNTKTR